MGSVATPQPQLDNCGENGGAPSTSGQVNLQGRADTAYTSEWDAAEQAALDSALSRFPADRHPPLERYVRAAACLPKKNVRDVALRVAWLRATAAARKRKMADEAHSKKQVRRERGQSIFAVQPKPPMGAGQMGHPMAASMGFSGMPAANMGMAPGMGMPAPIVMPPHGMAYAQPVVPMAPPLMPQLDDHGAGTVGGVGGPLAQLLEQNYAILNQFKQNMAAYKVNENTELLVRFRDNILTVLSHMDKMQGVMQQMPPLPVRLNVELANNFLPKAVANGMCQLPYMPAPLTGMAPGTMLGQQSSAGMMTPSMAATSSAAPQPTSSAFPAPPASSAAPDLAQQAVQQQHQQQQPLQQLPQPNPNSSVQSGAAVLAAPTADSGVGLLPPSSAIPAASSAWAAPFSSSCAGQVPEAAAAAAQAVLSQPAPAAVTQGGAALDEAPAAADACLSGAALPQSNDPAKVSIESLLQPQSQGPVPTEPGGLSDVLASLTALAPLSMPPAPVAAASQAAAAPLPVVKVDPEMRPEAAVKQDPWLEDGVSEGPLQATAAPAAAPECKSTDDMAGAAAAVAQPEEPQESGGQVAAAASQAAATEAGGAANGPTAGGSTPGKPTTSAGVGTRSSNAALSPGRTSRSTRSMATRRTVTTSP